MRRIALLCMVLLVCLAVAAGALAAAARAEVSIAGRRFTPAAITISPGDTVVWTNNDDLDHQIQAADGSFDSGKLKPGQSYSVRFARAGTFEYACALHPREKGRVIVRAK